MGSECDPSKPRYDLTMSKRTRKAFNNPQVANANAIVIAIANQNTNHSIFARPKKAADDDEEEENRSQNEDRKSLEQLINSDETANNRSTTVSLGRHFSKEEPQLQLVKKPQQCNNGTKLKGIVSRYAKVLSHLVKVKRDPSLGSKKKHLLRLSNVG